MGDQNVQELIDESFKAKEKAYCRYSNFPVGAALRCKDGQIVTGCNVENASYGLTICAERTAICKAVSQGFREFTAIAISSELTEEFISPCGMCRQSLAEFAPNMDVCMTKADKTYKCVKLSDLLPFTFTNESLAKGNSTN
ncbi:cytidine deaminase-like [Watersipora subatra]|uniref:cytidine deaminase-like n=1 Tax=Watersipora subatra TaxID=2589382 RepID=UPI00355C7C7F